MTVTELDVSLQPRGRRPQALEARVVGDIGESDLSLLAGARGTSARPVQRLRDRHHALARAIADGATAFEAAAITGYEPAWISSLQKTPAFKELVSHYQAVKDSAFGDFQERAASVTLDFLNHISDKLEEAPEEIGVAQALDIVKTLADRTGNAPVAKSVQVNATVDLTERLQKARARANAATKVIEAAE